MVLDIGFASPLPAGAVGFGVRGGSVKLQKTPLGLKADLP